MKHPRNNPFARFTPQALWLALLVVSLGLILLPSTADPKRSAPEGAAPETSAIAPQPAAAEPLGPPHQAPAPSLGLRAEQPTPEAAGSTDAAASQQFPHYGARIRWQDQNLEDLDIHNLPPEALGPVLTAALRAWLELESELLQAGTAHLGAAVDRRTAEQAYFSGACVYVLSPRAPSSRRQYRLVSSDPDPRALELRNLGISLLRSPGMQTHVKRACLLAAGSSFGWSEQELQLRPAPQGEGFEVYAPDGTFLAAHMLKLPGSP